MPKPVPDGLKRKEDSGNVFPFVSVVSLVVNIRLFS